MGSDPTPLEPYQILGRLADVLLIASVLPVLAQIKFASLSRAREAARAQVAKEQVKDKEKKEKEKKEEEQKGKDKEKDEKEEDKKEEKEEEQREIVVADDSDLMKDPSTGVLVLLLLAELCECAKLLDPKSGMSEKVIKELAKLSTKKPQGFIAVLDAFAYAVEKNATFSMVRIISALAGLGGLVLSRVAHQPNAPRQFTALAPFKEAFRTLKHILGLVMHPKLWAIAVMVIIFIVSNAPTLLKFFRNDSTLLFIKRFAVPLRCCAFASAAFGNNSAGAIPEWAVLQGAAVAVRIVYIFSKEKVPLNMVLKRLAGGYISTSTKGLLAIEAFSLLILVRPTVHRFRTFAAFGLFVSLAVATLPPGPMAVYINPMMMHYLSLMTVINSLMIIFTGGLSSVLMSAGFLKLITEFHRLDKVKI